MTPAPTSQSGNPSPDAHLDAETLQRRWNLVLPHREQLLRIARRRLSSREDAEDVVTTALLRTVEHRSLDEERVGAFLCTTVLRLVTDVHRERTRQLAIGIRDATRALPETLPEDAVCDDAEARWLSAQLDDCPERERQVLAARLAGLSPQECGTHLGLTAKAVENAFTRVRHRGQRLMAATLGVAPIFGRFSRRAGRPALVAVPVAAVAAFALVYVAPPATRGLPPAATALDAPGAGARDDVRNPTVRPTPRVTTAGSAATATAAATAAPAPALAAAPAGPQRTEIRVPAVVDRRTLDPGGLTVERRHEDESFMQSVWRCVNHLDLRKPTEDPCR